MRARSSGMRRPSLMFAYDYKNKFTLRVWGSTFKPALVKETEAAWYRVCDRTEATALLLDKTGKKGNRSYGYEYPDRKIL